jgi:hypothetical protein
MARYLHPSFLTVSKIRLKAKEFRSRWSYQSKEMIWHQDSSWNLWRNDGAGQIVANFLLFETQVYGTRTRGPETREFGLSAFSYTDIQWHTERNNSRKKRRCRPMPSYSR